MNQLQYQFDVILMGHLARDIIEVEGKQEVMTGGGVFAGGHAALTMGLKTGIITRCNKEISKDGISSLETAGATVFSQDAPETSGIHNIYDDPSMETRKCKPLGFAGLFDKKNLPGNWETGYFIICPIIAGELDLDLLKHLSSRYKDKLCIDVQGFVRVRVGNDLVFKDWEDKREGLKMITFLKTDHAEARNLTGLEDIDDALKELSSWGPREILLTHVKGVTVYVKGTTIFYPWKNKSMDGRTGRGDTCFTSYVGSRLEKKPSEALKFAAAITSLKMEVPGPISRPLEEILEFEKGIYD
ncbi:MAG: hypothetical protein ACFFCS_28195 [Candidatus Hodarchaeota archaeon]